VSGEAVLPRGVISASAGPLGELPWVSSRWLRLQHALGERIQPPSIRPWIDWLNEPSGAVLALGTPELLDRPSGLGKPGLFAQLTHTESATRIGLGLETPLVHALVDRLLGFTRQPGEERLPVTPIERGLIAYVLARSLAEGPAGASAGLVLDRVGPESFVIDGLGPIVTIRWPSQVGTLAGSVRLWLPECLLDRIPRAPAFRSADRLERARSLAATWRARAAETTLPRGLAWLRVGGVLPLDGAPLGGTAASPVGPITLTSRTRDTEFSFAAEVLPGSGVSRITLTSALRSEAIPREAIPVSVPSEAVPAPTEVPVTLTVELGRVTIPLHRLADLKPGDVLELGRHAREPVELTSNGRLVARGELVQIDRELGVRVTNVFL
jgi:flagellar motor switch protein FliN